MLPPGAARLFTKPEPTGSTFCRKIIGIVRVSCMTAAVTGVEMTTITLGSNATSSLARAFIASTEPPAHRFSIRTLPPSIPLPFIRWFQSITSAAPTRTFLGSHPRKAQVPPNGRESIMATCQPAFRHCEATVEAAVPVPITTRSNFLVMDSRSSMAHWRLGSGQAYSIRCPQSRDQCDKRRGQGTFQAGATTEESMRAGP